MFHLPSNSNNHKNYQNLNKDFGENEFKKLNTKGAMKI